MYNFSKSKLQEFEERIDALTFLARNYFEFPEEVPYGYCKDISFDIYKNFKFVRCPDGEIVFGNCYVPAITKKDFDKYKPLRLQ